MSDSVILKIAFAFAIASIFVPARVQGLKCFHCHTKTSGEEECVSKGLKSETCADGDDACMTSIDYDKEGKASTAVCRMCVKEADFIQKNGSPKPDDEGCFTTKEGDINQKVCLCKTDDCNKQDGTKKEKQGNGAQGIHQPTTGNQQFLQLIAIGLLNSILVAGTVGTPI